MGMLLAKMLLLLGIAAACGAGFVYWWFRRNYEDITLEYLRSREEWAVWRRSFEERLAARPAVDLQPLAQQLAAVDAAVRAIRIPEMKPTDLRPVLDAVAGVQLPAPEPLDLAPLEARLDEIERRIGAIRVPDAPPPADLSPLVRGLAALETAVSGITIPSHKEELSALAAQLQQMHTRIEGIRTPEAPPPSDLTPIEERLGTLEGAVRSIQLPPSQTLDLAPVMERLDALQASLENPPPPRVGIREGSRNLLTHAGHGKPDDLTQIKGVAKVVERRLHRVGVFYFWQIAEWSAEDVAYVDRQLADYRGRIERDDWVSQAAVLAASPQAAHRPPTEH